MVSKFQSGQASFNTERLEKLPLIFIIFGFIYVLLFTWYILFFTTILITTSPNGSKCLLWCNSTSSVSSPTTPIIANVSSSLQLLSQNDADDVLVVADVKVNFTISQNLAQLKSIDDKKAYISLLDRSIELQKLVIQSQNRLLAKQMIEISKNEATIQQYNTTKKLNETHVEPNATNVDPEVSKRISKPISENIKKYSGSTSLNAKQINSKSTINATPPPKQSRGDDLLVPLRYLLEMKPSTLQRLTF